MDAGAAGLFGAGLVGTARFTLPGVLGRGAAPNRLPPAALVAVVACDVLTCEVAACEAVICELELLERGLVLPLLEVSAAELVGTRVGTGLVLELVLALDVVPAAN